MSAPQIPQRVSPDGREIWDWANRLSEHTQRLHKARELRAQINETGMFCGDCDNWMKSRQCPKEWNDNGRTRGPSCKSLRCPSFVLTPQSAKLRDERQAELDALTDKVTGEQP